MDKFGYDYIDGKYIEPLIIQENYSMTGEHHGTVYVKAGKFTLHGDLKGSLNVQNRAKVEIIGKQQGSVHLTSGATLVIQGSVEGSVSLEQGSILIVEARAKLAGSLHNNGKVIVRGVFGGAQSGKGELILEGGGYIKEPIIKNGVNYYNW